QCQGRRHGGLGLYRATGGHRLPGAGPAHGTGVNPRPLHAAPADPGALVEACFALPRAWGEAPGQGVLKTAPDDFVVDEVLGFEPDGEGRSEEHTSELQS